MKKVCIATALCSAVFLSACNDTNTIATVSGDKISQSEFDAYLKFKRIPEQDENRVGRALDEYINRAALAKAISKSGKINNDLMAAELEEFRRQMIIGRYFEQHLKTVVDDTTVRNYYTSNPQDYETERVRAGHILIRVDTKMSETERQAKLTTAQEAYSLLRKGDDFAEVAKKFSEDKVSAGKGGDLGWLNKGAVAPEFSKKLFDLKPGEVTEPFLTPFGFHVVKMIEAPQLVKRPVESVEGDIRYRLRNEAKVAETDRLLYSVKITKKD